MIPRKHTDSPESLEDTVDQLTPKRRKRGEMSNEGKEVWEMSEHELQQLNDKWGYWMNQLEHTLRWYAWGDEDLTQIGILNLRKTLCEDINTPPNHLLRKAKYAIWTASSYGKSVDSKKSAYKNQTRRNGGIELIYTDSFDNPYDNPLLSDELNCKPDVLAIDQIAYEQFRQDLNPSELKLLDLMRETAVKVQQQDIGQFKQKFIRETGSTYSNYGATKMSLLQKFYHHYGSPEEIEAFETFYRKWRPRKPMYHGRSRKRG